MSSANSSTNTSNSSSCPAEPPKPKEKKPRMVVRAIYRVENEFRIPRGIDLEDKEQVDSWGIKWDTMEIFLKNGQIIEVNPTFSIGDHDMKRPDDTVIDEDDNQDDDDEDEEADGVGPECEGCGVRESKE
jgi:hypothetical protein